MKKDSEKQTEEEGWKCSFRWHIGKDTSTYRARVVDPDPGSDPKHLAGSKSDTDLEKLILDPEFEVKLLWKTDKIWQFLSRNAQIKNINPFL